MNQTTTGTDEISLGSPGLFDKPVAVQRFILFFAILLVGLVVDLLTKQLIFGKYFQADSDAAPRPVWILGDWLGIQTSTNQGALFGMGQGLTVVFAVLSVLALAILIYLLFVNRWANDLFITITFAMIAGGILGNLYDRLGIWHDANIALEHRNAVRDWIHFNWEGGPKLFNPWPNFNIADCLLVCGAILLCIHAVFIQPQMEDGQNGTEKNSSDPPPKNRSTKTSN